MRTEMEEKKAEVVLGIDPGTHCGWAVRSGDGHYLSGVWSLQNGRFEGGGMRFVRLKKLLKEIVETTGAQIVVFEEVRRHLGTDAAHIYGGIVSHITAFCEERKIPYAGVPVGTIKKVATGKGNANKERMLGAAAQRWPDYQFEDDNEADARWVVETYLAGRV